ncbi:MAG: hypothetical protein RL374_536 [Actinomycetota bacterium]|jgi:hypothetical protein
MVVNERDRLKLAHRLQDLIGEEATILMEHLPYGGIAGIVSKDDLVLFKAEIHTDMTELRSDLRLEMAELRAEIYKALNSQTLKIITVMTALNGLMFAGLKWG